MDSINFVKGYGKVTVNPNNLENQTQNPSHKRRRLIAISALLVVSLAIGLVIGALSHESATESPELPLLASNSANSTIRTICNFTRFPDACVSSMTAANNPPESDPKALLKLSVEVAIAETSKLSSALESMNSGDAATRDCRDLVEEALSRLNDSAVAIAVGPGKGDDLTAEKMKDLQTWIGTAATDEETCLDGLEETGSAVFDEVKAKMDKSKEYISNALAIVANFHAILDKLKNMHR